MKILHRLFSAYQNRGFTLRTGLNPYYFNDPDAPFTGILKADTPLQVGRGLAPLEILFLESLITEISHVQNALVIGNAFGWSTLALAMSAPKAHVVAVDANIEGSESLTGKALTLEIAADENLNVNVVDGISPQDISSIVKKNFDSKLDFILIDGLHYSPQLIADFEACLPYASSHCVVFMHDVLNWHMLSAIDSIRSHPRVHQVHILDRLPSGVGIALLSPPPTSLDILCENFKDDEAKLRELWDSLGATANHAGLLCSRLAQGYPTAPVHKAILDSVGSTAENRLKNIHRSLEQAENRPSALFTAACNLLDNGMLSEAEPLFIKTTYHAPNWAEPYHQLGRIAKHDGRFDASREYFLRASRLDPAYPPPILERAALAASLGHIDESEVLLEELVKLAPHWPDAQFFHIQFLLEYRGFDAALQRCILFQHTLPTQILKTWSLLESTIQATPSPSDNIAPLYQACKKSPTLKILWRLSSIAQRRSGYLEDALSSLQHALSLDPNCPNTLTELGRTYYLLGNIDETRRHFMQAKYFRSKPQ